MNRPRRVVASCGTTDAYGRTPNGALPLDGAGLDAPADADVRADRTGDDAGDGAGAGGVLGRQAVTARAAPPSATITFEDLCMRDSMR